MGEKSSEAFRTISEVADEINVPQHVLRFWEGRFPQIKPLKRAGGRRYYRPEDVELLARIRDLLYTQGYTIKGVQNLLKDGIDNVMAGDSNEKPSIPIVTAHATDPVAPIEAITQLPDLAPPPPSLPLEPLIERANQTVSSSPSAAMVDDDDEMPGLFARIEPAVTAPPAEIATTHEPQAFNLHVSRIEPITPSPVLPVAQATPTPTFAPLSADLRGQLEAIVDELEQLRFLLRAQD